MICRPATPDDARDVWLWRNDPLTRAMSRNTDEVAWEGHAAWFEKALANPAITLLIGEVEGEKVGMVRFDHGPETEVSINVNPACRGRGYGLALLRQSIALAGGEVFAEIRDENLASRRMFERAGFRLVATLAGRGRYRRPAG
jgi:L-amino acid N-acyltransferase YncA